MNARLFWLPLACLISACGAPKGASSPGGSAGPKGASSPAPLASPRTSTFVPLGSPPDVAPADKAPGPTCSIIEYVLGPLANPGESLFPVSVVADARGGLAAWIALDGLALRRVDGGGAPSGSRASLPGPWPSIPVLLLSPEEVILLVTTESEIRVSRLERASLRPLGERRFPRPGELARFVDAAVDGADLWLVGTRERDMVFLRLGREGPPRPVVARLPRELPSDPLVTLGRKDGGLAAWISLIGGDTWLATESGVRDAVPGDVTPLPGRFVRAAPIDMRTGMTRFGLEAISSVPLSRDEDSRLQQEKPEEAFQTHGTHGFPGTAWTGTHFLFSEARGPSGEGRQDKLSAVVTAVDCGGGRPR